MPKILVITPARNEEYFIGKTLRALGRQKPKPAMVVVINDGSTDKTVQVAKEALEEIGLKYKIINRKDRGSTALGLPKLALVYNDGFRSVDLSKYDYLIINGADSLLTDDYTEQILQYFDKYPNLVITSGSCPGEKINISHVHGSAGRVYRMSYFIEVCQGKYELSYAWESIPIYKGDVSGKLIRHFEKPYVYHLRPRNTNAPMPVHYYRGIAKKVAGYWFVYAFALAIRVTIRNRNLKAGIYFIVGFLKNTKSKFYVKGLTAFQKTRLINRIKLKLNLLN